MAWSSSKVDIPFPEKEWWLHSAGRIGISKQFFKNHLATYAKQASK